MKASIYISRKVLNYHDIVDWARDVGFTTMMPEDSLHVTVVYCKHKVDWNTVDRDQPEMILVPAEKDDEEDRAVHNFNAGACVLEIKSDDLLERNEELRALGIHSKFPDYRAHITITYDKPKDMDVDDIEPYRGPIILGPERIKEASNDWQDDYKEIDLTESKLATIYERALGVANSPLMGGL